MWQALAGKNVKDMLLNVGSGGGAAAAAPTGGASGGAAAADAPVEKEEEKKEEGRTILILAAIVLGREILTNLPQRRKSPTRTWASVFSTKRALLYLFSAGSL